MNPRLESSYQQESAALLATRIPLASGIFLFAICTTGIIEMIHRPEILWTWARFSLAEATALAVPLLFRKRLSGTTTYEIAVVASWVVVVGLIYGYVEVAPLSTAAAGLVAICIMTGGSLLASWSLTSQCTLSAAATVGFCALVIVRGESGIDTTFSLFAVLSGALISLQGTWYMDLHRRAIYREAIRSDDEAAITRSLEEFAKELNRGLSDDGVAERVATLALETMETNWVLVMQPAETTDTMRIVAGDGELPSSIDNLKALEVPVNDLPFLENDSNATIKLVEGWETRSSQLLRRLWGRHVLVAPLHHRGRRIGVILTGAEEVCSKSHRLFRGIAQHAAIAMANAQLLDELRRASSMKSEFLATMSHELRTPLHVIMGYTEMLNDLLGGTVDAEVTQILQRLAQNETSLTDLIEATLDAHRLEAGRNNVKRRKFRGNTLFEQLRSDIRSLPRTPGVDVQWSIPESPVEMYSDPIKLKVIAKNLIGNALKFTKRGHVRVDVEIDDDDKRLLLTVTDTGPGIPEAEIPQIFEMFRQATPTASESSLAGVGLGLFIVREFVAQLDGSVSVDNHPGGGARFAVDVPLDIAVAPASSSNRLVA